MYSDCEFRVELFYEVFAQGNLAPRLFFNFNDLAIGAYYVA